MGIEGMQKLKECGVAWFRSVLVEMEWVGRITWIQGMWNRAGTCGGGEVREYIECT